MSEQGRKLSVREARRHGGHMTCREAGQRGGETTSARHSHEHFREIGRQGGKKSRELIERGKAIKDKEAAG